MLEKMANQTFFDLSLPRMKQYLTLSNSFDNDYFQKYCPAVMRSALRHLFDMEAIAVLFDTMENFIDGLPVSIKRKERLNKVVSEYAVTVSFLTAIPELDTIVMKGGIVVTNADGVTPASQFRVERLITELKERRDILLRFIHTELRSPAYANASPLILREQWLQTIIQDPIQTSPVNGSIETFYEHYDILKVADNEIATRFLGAAMVKQIVKDIAEFKPLSILRVIAAEASLHYFKVYLQLPPEERENIPYADLMWRTRFQNYFQHNKKTDRLLELYDYEIDPLGIAKKKLDIQTRNFVV